MDKFWDYIEDEDRIVRPVSLLLGIVAIGAAAIAFDGIFEKVFSSRYRFLAYLIIECLWIGYWLYKKHKLPSTTKGKIGIVLALKTENNKTKIRLREDFVKRLNELILSNHLGSLMEVVLLKTHQAERLIPFFDELASQMAVDNTTPAEKSLMQRWSRLRKRTRGHLFVWGTIKQREENKYFVDTNFLIVSRPYSRRGKTGG